MSIFEIKVDTTDTEMLLIRVKAAANNRDVMDDATAFLLNRIRTRFLKEMDTEEKPWPPSKAAIKRRRAGGTGTLFDTGFLFRSIQPVIKMDTERTIQTDVYYAPYVFFGTSKMVGRDFLGVSDKDAALLEKKLFRGIAARAGL